MPAPIRIVPLGGLGEIGKNMLAIECGDDIVVVDSGVMFPEEEMLGVDLVIPDISYLEQRRDRIRGIFITHGHEDHIGALPYVLPALRAPVYSTRLTHGLISVRLREKGGYDAAPLHVAEPGAMLQVGGMQAEFFRVAHSIPDACGLAFHTAGGTVVHTGDFKFDHTPVDGRPTDMAKLAALGTQGVKLLLSDSTYADHAGYTPSEKVLGSTLLRLISEAPGRVIIACFASLISRIQQIIDAAIICNRKVLLVGRSIQDNVAMAQELGYLYAPDNVIIGVDEMRRLRDDQLVVVATGAQGEPTAALARIASKDHRHVRVKEGDTVVLSATPIPGNELLVARTIDNLFRQGARVLYSPLEQVHVHGHAAQEELKLMLNLVRPEHFIPVHGEYRHLVHHRRLAEAVGVRAENCYVLTDGEIIEIGDTGGKLAEKLPGGHVYVDGLGELGHEVLRDRQHLANDGMVVIMLPIDHITGRLATTPEIVQRGFVADEEAASMMDQARAVVERAVGGGSEAESEWSVIAQKVKEAVGQFFYQQTRRRPLLLAVPVEV